MSGQDYTRTQYLPTIPGYEAFTRRKFDEWLIDQPESVQRAFIESGHEFDYHHFIAEEKPSLDQFVHILQTISDLETKPGYENFREFCEKFISIDQTRRRLGVHGSVTDYTDNIAPNTGFGTVFESVKRDLGMIVHAYFQDDKGELDLNKLTAESFEEFKGFLIDQAYVDGKALRSPYRRIISEEKYEPLLKFLYVHQPSAIDNEDYTEICEPFGSSDPALMSALAIQLRADLIDTDGTAYVRQFINNDAGREHLRVLLNNEELYSIDTLHALIVGIRDSAKEQLGKSRIGTLSLSLGVGGGLINFLDSSNPLSLTDGDYDAKETAIICALDVLDKFDPIEEDIAARDSRLAKQDSYISRIHLNKEVFVYENIATRLGLTVDEETENAKIKKTDYIIALRDNPVSEFRIINELVTKLCNFWLMAADEKAWDGQELWEVSEAETLRLYLLERIEDLIAEAISIETDWDLSEFITFRLNRFVHDPIHEGGVPIVREVMHHVPFTGGTGIESWLSDMPGILKAPYESLVTLNDQIKYAYDKDETLIAGQRVIEAEFENEELKMKGNETIGHLDRVKRELWFGYKQHGWLARGGSFTGNQLGYETDISQIQAAIAVMDELIEEIVTCTEENFAETMTRISERLFDEMCAGGTLYTAISEAASNEGIQQLIRVVQFVVEAAMLSVMTGGLGAGAQATYFAKMMRAFAAGAGIITIDNAMECLTAGYRPGSEKVSEWLFDALSTGLASTLVGMPFIPNAAGTTFFTRLLGQYFPTAAAGGLEGAASATGRAALAESAGITSRASLKTMLMKFGKGVLTNATTETLEEVVDQHVRELFKGNFELLTKQALIDLVMISFMSGGAEIASLRALVSDATGTQDSTTPQGPDTGVPDVSTPRIPIPGGATLSTLPDKSPLGTDAATTREYIGEEAIPKTTDTTITSAQVQDFIEGKEPQADTGFADGTVLTVHVGEVIREVVVRGPDLVLMDARGTELGALQEGTWTLRDAEDYPVGEYTNGRIVRFDVDTATELMAVQATMDTVSEAARLSREHEVEHRDLVRSLEELESTYAGSIEQSIGVQSELFGLRMELETGIPRQDAEALEATDAFGSSEPISMDQLAREHRVGRALEEAHRGPEVVEYGSELRSGETNVLPVDEATAVELLESTRPDYRHNLTEGKRVYDSLARPYDVKGDSLVTREGAPVERDSLLYTEESPEMPVGSYYQGKLYEFKPMRFARGRLAEGKTVYDARGNPYTIQNGRLVNPDGTVMGLGDTYLFEEGSRKPIGHYIDGILYDLDLLRLTAADAGEPRVTLMASSERTQQALTQYLAHRKLSRTRETFTEEPARPRREIVVNNEAMKAELITLKMAAQTRISANDLDAVFRDGLDGNEHSLFHFEDGTPVFDKGSGMTSESLIFEAGDHRGVGGIVGAVRALEWTAHLHTGKPIPSPRDLAIVTARAMLEPGEMQRHIPLGHVGGERSFVIIEATYRDGKMEYSFTGFENVSESDLAILPRRAAIVERGLRGKTEAELTEIAVQRAAAPGTASKVMEALIYSDELFRFIEGTPVEDPLYDLYDKSGHLTPAEEKQVDRLYNICEMASNLVEYPKTKLTVDKLKPLIEAEWIDLPTKEAYLEQLRDKRNSPEDVVSILSRWQRETFPPLKIQPSRLEAITSEITRDRFLGPDTRASLKREAGARGFVTSVKESFGVKAPLNKKTRVIQAESKRTTSTKHYKDVIDSLSDAELDTLMALRDFLGNDTIFWQLMSNPSLYPKRESHVMFKTMLHTLDLYRLEDGSINEAYRDDLGQFFVTGALNRFNKPNIKSGGGKVSLDDLWGTTIEFALMSQYKFSSDRPELFHLGELEMFEDSLGRASELDGYDESAKTVHEAKNAHNGIKLSTFGLPNLPGSDPGQLTKFLGLMKEPENRNDIKRLEYQIVTYHTPRTKKYEISYDVIREVAETVRREGIGVDQEVVINLYDDQYNLGRTIIINSEGGVYDTDYPHRAGLATH